MENKKLTMAVMAILAIAAFAFAYVFVYQKQEEKKIGGGAEKQSTIEKKMDVTRSGSDMPDDGASREQCFQMLKDNMREAGIFELPLQEMEKMTYADLSPKFSRNYKSLSSFGLDVSQGAFEMRLYSFGRQTGYIHPPVNPFPTSTKSEIWDEPAKEFIVAEEYVTDLKGEKYFMDCIFFSISSDEPMKVTRENYLYDGAMISLNKTAPDQSYKSWYSENVSFDHAGKSFVNWNRLFIYPKSSQNEYFDKYAVAEAYPGNKVESLDVLKFFLQPIIQLQDYDDKNQATIKYMVFKEGEKEPVEVEKPKELEPVKYEGANKIFPMSSYYQAIENQFPEFARLLSFRGTLKYETFKQILTEKEVNPEVEKIVSALVDYRQLVTYDINKKANNKDGMVVTDDELDKLLVDVADADAAIGKIVGESKGDVNSPFQERDNDEKAKDWSYGSAILAIIGILLIVLVSVFAWRKYSRLNR